MIQEPSTRGDMPNIVNLAIKMNNTATAEACALCGAPLAMLAGPALFLADSWAPVCRDCGARYAPELARMLGLGGLYDCPDAIPF